MTFRMTSYIRFASKLANEDSSRHEYLSRYRNGQVMYNELCGNVPLVTHFLSGYRITNFEHTTLIYEHLYTYFKELLL